MFNQIEKNFNSIEQKLFSGFLFESSESIYIKTFNLEEPLKSILLTFICDIFTNQDFKSKQHYFIKEFILEDELNIVKINIDYDQFLAFLKRHKYNYNYFIVYILNRTFLQPKNNFIHIEKTITHNPYALNKNYISIPFNYTHFKNKYNLEMFEYDDPKLHLYLLPQEPFKNKIIEKFKIHINNIFSLSIHNFRNAFLFNKLKKESTLAAISQCFARCQSHNTANHVLSSIKHVNDFTKMLKQIEMYDSTKKNTHFQFISIHNAKKNKNPPIKETNYIYNLFEKMAIFNDYLKFRMDFLAEISTTKFKLENQLYFKSQLMENFTKNTILLNKISGVENSQKFKFEYTGILKATDVLVSIPNDLQGAHALYIIIENIIRNTFKHGVSNSKNIIFYLNIKKDKNPLFYTLNIYDNQPQENIQTLVKKRNESFLADILENNTLRPFNLGSVELLICANYLQNISFLNNTNNAIRAYSQPLSKNKNSLGYTLFLKKQTEILIVNCDENDANFNTYFKNNNLIETTNFTKFKDQLNTENTGINYKIIYFYKTNDNQKIVQFIKKNIHYLTNRVLINPVFNFEKNEDIIEWIWKQYFIQFIKPKIKSIYNYIKIIFKNSYTIIDIQQEHIQIINENIIDKKAFTIFINDHNQFIQNKRNYNYIDFYKDETILKIIKNKLISNTDFLVEKIKYIEVILSKIMVIDERIQRNLLHLNYTTNFNGKEVKTNIIKYFKNQHVHIISKKEINLQTSNFNLKYKNDKTITEKIGAIISTNINNLDYIIIHLGILEKMFGKHIFKEILILFNNNFHKLYIITGRGIILPKLIKNKMSDKQIKFIPLSPIQNAIETVNDKVLLYNLLINTR